jgi:hypothetical protein
MSPMKRTETPTERRHREMLQALSGLMAASQNATPIPAPAPTKVRFPRPKTWKGWTALGLLAMAALGAVTPDSNSDAVSLTSTAQTTTVSVPVCQTEDQDGLCVWKGTVRYWDSRSDAEKAAATPTVTVTRTAKATPRPKSVSGAKVVCSATS